MVGIVTNSFVVAGHTNQFGTLVPSAGANRRFIVGHSIEQSSTAVADAELVSVTMRGETATLIDGAWRSAASARGLQLFEFTETQIAAIESAGTGDVVFNLSSGPLSAGAYEHAFCFTIEDSVQTAFVPYKVEDLNTGGTPAEPLPHELTVPSALTGELVVFVGHCSQPDSATWNGATEFGDDAASSHATHAAYHVAASDGDVTAGISPDGGISYATSIIGFRVADAASANNDPTLDTPIADISVPANTSGTIADISGNFSDADGDTLTYSVTPALPTGMTLNTTTGVISGNGSITEAAAANYTFSASDGQGGTDASDVVNIAVTTPAPVLTQALNVRLGSTMTIDTDASIDLTTYTTITATLGGVSCGASTRVAAGQIDFNVPGGLELGVDHPLIVTADGAQSNTLQVSIGAPTGKQVITLTSVDANSVLNDYAGTGPNNIGADDQWVPDSVTDKGNTINITADGLFEIVNGAANAPHTFDWFYLDAQDNYAQSDTQTVTFSSTDTTPDQFDLGLDVTGAEPGAQTQRTFTIQGIDAGENVTINAVGAATVNPTIGQLGDTITVTLTAGTFDAVVSGGAEINGVSDTFSVTSRSAVAPTVTTQPTAQTVNDGETATFTAVFANASSVQWYNGGDDSVIAGATSAAYSFAAALGDSGNTYYAVASNDGLTVQTVTVGLTVNAAATPPTMGADTTATVAENTTAVGTYAATGSAPISYSVSGTDAAAFTVSNTGVLAFASAPDFEAQTSYSVTITATNSAGSDSQTITVNVTNVVESLPTITTTGGTSITLQQGAAYSDPAWSWADDVVSGQAVSWSGPVDTATIGTYTRTATATNAIGTVTQDYTVTVQASAPEYVDPREVLKFAKPNDLVFLHDGSEIPTTAPKSPNSTVYKGFQLLGLEDSESIQQYFVLIEGQLVEPGDTVNGLQYVSAITNSKDKVKVLLSGGVAGLEYRLTLRFTTQNVPLDECSQDFEVKPL